MTAPGTVRARSGAQPIRRAAVLVLLVAGLVVGPTLPSWATFDDRTAVSTTIATETVAPVTNLTASAKCTGSSATVTLKWTLSPTPRVSGYGIRVYLNNAYQDQAVVSPTGTTWQGTTDRYYVDNYTMTFTVWTLTDYGWMKETARTPRIVC